VWCTLDRRKSAAIKITFLSIKARVLAKLIETKDLPSPAISEDTQITLLDFSLAIKLKLVLTDLTDSANTDFGCRFDKICVLFSSTFIGKCLMIPIIGVVLRLSIVSLS